MLPDFTDPSYLLTGSPIQQEGHRAMMESCIIDRLRAFSPVLCGTLPLDLFTEGSDLDILCEDYNAPLFEEILLSGSRQAEPIEVKKFVSDGLPATLARFHFGGFWFEIIGQARPYFEQKAYRHMVNEYLLLEKYGPSLRRKVLDLKQSGMKTEPAFAQALGLKGDPYLALLQYVVA